MTPDALNWLAQLAALDSPALPELASQQLWRSLGWGILLASLLAWVGRGWKPRLRWTAVAALALLSGVAGPISPVYWLGLAFQAPSISAVGLCVFFLQSCWAQPANYLAHVPGQPADGVSNGTGRPGTLGNPSAPVVPMVLACLGIALGWILLADTLAWTPVAVYAWGFSPLASAGVLLVLLAPWVWTGQNRALSLVLALGLAAGFVALRLPSGNAWDAVLDPWLWVFLHGYVVRPWWIRRKH